MNAKFHNTVLNWLAVPLASMALGILPADSSAAAIADGGGVPAEAAADLYSRISARDLEGVLRYVPAEGFTEVGVGASEVHLLDRHAFEAFFKADLAIDLRAVDIAARVFGDAAIVTGMRVGSITPKGQHAQENRALFTMVWLRSDGRWLLRHVHLSAVQSEPPAR